MRGSIRKHNVCATVASFSDTNAHNRTQLLRVITHMKFLLYLTKFLVIKYLKYVCIRLEILQILVYGYET